MSSKSVAFFQITEFDNIDNNSCENMQFIGSKHVLLSETNENNLFVINCHANNQGISTIVTKNVYF